MNMNQAQAPMAPVPVNLPTIAPKVPQAAVNNKSTKTVAKKNEVKPSKKFEMFTKPKIKNGKSGKFDFKRRRRVNCMTMAKVQYCV
jgi:hypothetical protein